MMVLGAGSMKWLVLLCGLFSYVAADPGNQWQESWPDTDFSTATIDLAEVLSGGPGKEGIPAIDEPLFVKIYAVHDIGDDEPVIALSLNGKSKAYPLRVLMWHEIVNDFVGEMPVSVTYCPLCNTSIVFDRRLDGQLLDFGTTGNLRHSDLIMYDRQTESWWQQYSGEAIVGRLAGKSLQVIPSRLESYASFKKRFPEGLVLVPRNSNARRYGSNPYVGYERSPFPFLYRGTVPAGVVPMMRVVAIDDLAFSLPMLREKSLIEKDGLRISWSKGQNSSLDEALINSGRDVGNVVVSKDGRDQAYVVTFAFAFFAFHPEGRLNTLTGAISLAP